MVQQFTHAFYKTITGMPPVGQSISIKQLQKHHWLVSQLGTMGDPTNWICACELVSSQKHFYLFVVLFGSLIPDLGYINHLILSRNLYKLITTGIAHKFIWEHLYPGESLSTSFTSTLSHQNQLDRQKCGYHSGILAFV